MNTFTAVLHRVIAGLITRASIRAQWHLAKGRLALSYEDARNTRHHLTEARALQDEIAALRHAERAAVVSRKNPRQHD